MQKRGSHDFPSKIFGLTVPKNFIGEHFGVTEIFLTKIFMHRRGGGGITVLSKIFCLTGPKRKALYGNPSVFQKISGIEKILLIRGGISRFSVEIFMSHSAEKFRKRTLLLFRKILVSQKYYRCEGGITFFHRKFFVSQCRKIS